ncbi:isochorismatase family protein [Kiloniella laminariae]|uniref:Isochorismatase family protein n=1 Tax=Kiloniella laminariae TaxID=454162 RepID=A0ABT4LE18_9PROT|nr:isochorismatase family protein [Kiloniella laminariae]MCZ4279347.1 isochorismatase family protein [Kiloniella laminariae]
MKALLVIDFQKAISFEPAAHALMETRDVLLQALETARSQGIPVVFVQHSEAGTPFERNTEGWEFFGGVAPLAGEAVVEKASCDAFRHTRLDEVLRSLGADTLIIGGYATEFCIDTSIRAAASKGYKTLVMQDGHTTRNREHLSATEIKKHHNWIWPNMANPAYEICLLPAADCFKA